MPFSAILPNGERVISTLTSDEEWEKIKAHSKAGELLMGWSNLPCIAKTSHLGTRHFAHKPGQTPPLHWSETTEHLLLKAKVLEYARELGWEAQTEVMSADRTWIADTLLTKGERTVAIEVQWSRQSLADYEFRQRRYAGDGVECYWITRHEVYSWRGNNHVPAFVINKPEEVIERDGEIDVYFRRELDSLEVYLSMILAGEIRPREKVCRVKDILCSGCNQSFLAFPIGVNYRDVVEAYSSNYQRVDNCAENRVSLGRQSIHGTLACPNCFFEYRSNESIKNEKSLGYFEFNLFRGGDPLLEQEFFDLSFDSTNGTIQTIDYWDGSPARDASRRFQWLGGKTEKELLESRLLRYKPASIGRKYGFSFREFEFEGVKFAVALYEGFGKPPVVPQFLRWCSKNSVIPITYGLSFVYVMHPISGQIVLRTNLPGVERRMEFEDLEGFLVDQVIYHTRKNSTHS